ncbi:MAG: nitronate monooxygenase, partial [Formosa sp.]|nr:nitronate monooxygenase [Formosa sp.]
SVGITEDRWKDTKKIDFGKELNPAEAEAKAWKTIWSAGQGVTNISDNPSVKDLIDLMKKEFKAAIEVQQALLEKY